MGKLSMGIWAGVWIGLCCTANVCAAATQTDAQVIVEGGVRADDTVRTGGHDVPLLHALEQIVPASYSVNVPNAGAWADMPVSWRPGHSFVYVLSKLLAGNPSLQARVDTDMRLVTVTALPPVPGLASGMPVSATAPAPALVAGPVPAPDAPNASSRAQHAEAVAAQIASALPATRVAPQPAPQVAPQPAPQVAPQPAPPVTPQLASQAVPQPAPHAAPQPAPVVEAEVSPQPTPHASRNHTGASSNAALSMNTDLSTPPPMAAPQPAPAATPAGRTEWQMNLSDGTVRNAFARWASEAGW